MDQDWHIISLDRLLYPLVRRITDIEFRNYFHKGHLYEAGFRMDSNIADIEHHIEKYYPKEIYQKLVPLLEKLKTLNVSITPDSVNLTDIRSDFPFEMATVENDPIVIASKQEKTIIEEVNCYIEYLENILKNTADRDIKDGGLGLKYLRSERPIIQTPAVSHKKINEVKGRRGAPKKINNIPDSFDYIDERFTEPELKEYLEGISKLHTVLKELEKIDCSVEDFQGIFWGKTITNRINWIGEQKNEFAYFITKLGRHIGADYKIWQIASKCFLFCGVEFDSSFRGNDSTPAIAKKLKNAISLLKKGTK